MRPLTDHTPKPLLQVAGVPLLEHHIRRLVSVGCPDLVINVSHLGQKIVDYFGTGRRWGANILWSFEEEPLETAGGIIKALGLLGPEPFMLVNGDIWTDYPFIKLQDLASVSENGAHLVLVDNPAQHPLGDFALLPDRHLELLGERQTGLTYAGLGVYTAEFFAGVEREKLPLKPLLDRAIERNFLTGEYYPGLWIDVGTPERLATLNAHLA